MQLEELKRTFRNAGLRGVGTDLWCRGAHKLCRFLDMHVLVLTPATLDPDALQTDADVRYGFLDDAALRPFADTPGMDLPAAFVAEALAKGDRCYGAWIGDQLACYCWFAANTTLVNEELLLHFDPQWHYGYKMLTLPAFRSHRLAAAVATQAMVALVAAGSKGLIVLVNVNNYSSLKATFRMGFQKVGRMRAAKLGGRWLAGVSESCAPYGMRISPVRPSRRA